MSIDYSIIRSGRRSCSIQVLPDGQVVVRAPLHMSDDDIARLVQAKQGWLTKTREQVLMSLKRSDAPALTLEQVRQLADEATAVIPERVRHYAPLVGVSYGRISIRNQVSKWGSCTSTGNLSFNCLLMLAPREVLDYIVVHELCHRRHMDHSPQFWADVERVLPEYERAEQWLKQNGGALIENMRQNCRG